MKKAVALAGLAGVIGLCVGLGGCGPSSTTPTGERIRARPPEPNEKIDPPSMAPDNQDRDQRDQR
ncbi:MAG TPA: hypothetical protein PKC43_11055 [Phycisphaerales bacterium]|nr:hypothetical protein [Phycisphaerales bacterium]HMP37972.1 hypothetical protein [Phycisphaerales bacterium]